MSEFGAADIPRLDDKGKYEVPFPVLFRNDCWLNASTYEELEAFVLSRRGDRRTDSLWLKRFERPKQLA